jgi:2'-5' RNA ligase
MARLFFALWPPQRSAATLARWTRNLAIEGRATRAETIHLTLAFLGEVAAARIEPACDAARGVRFAPFELEIDVARYWKHNRILWVGPQQVPAELTALAAQLAAELRAAGFALEERAFAAHITLVRKAEAPKVLPAPPRVAWPCDEFVLVRSRPSREGSAYEVLQRFPAA